MYLETQGWQKLHIIDKEIIPDSDVDSKSNPMEPIVQLGQRFQIPLEGAGVDIDRLPGEFLEMVLHATQFISVYSPRLSQGMTGGCGLGIFCGHIKAVGLFLFPHRTSICAEGLQGRHALRMLGRTLQFIVNHGI